MLLAWGAPVRAQNDALAEHAYRIPEQPLAAALLTLANSSKISIAYDADLVAALRSHPVNGTFTPQIALTILLEGTSLTARFTGPRSVILFDPRSPQATAQADAQGLPSDRPTMNFDLAVVRAPRTIGRRDPGAMNDYLRRAEQAMQDMFAGDPSYQGAPFDIRIAVSVASDGTIEDMSLLRPSGATARDALVRRLVLGRNIGAPPAEGISRPLQFHIAGRSAGSARDGRP